MAYSYPKYDAHWKRLLDTVPNRSVELLASLRETALNEYLAKHREHDKERYKHIIERTFSDGTIDRKFTIIIEVGAPIQIELPPFAPASQFAKYFKEPKGWSELLPPPPGAGLHYPVKLGDPNIRLTCASLKFRIRWPRLDGTGYWEWRPDPLQVVAEARLDLIEVEQKPCVQLQMTRIKFSPIEKASVSVKLQRRLKRLPLEERALADNCEECEQKFFDLLVIGLNVVATHFAPQMVRNINIPLPAVGGKALIPVLLDLSSKVVSLGATVDPVRLAEDSQLELKKRLDTYRFALAQDIEKAGGLEKLVVASRTPNKDGLYKFKYRTKQQVLSRLTRSNAYLRELEATLRPRDRSVARMAGVDDGVGLAVNEYLLETVVTSKIPAPIEECTGWFDPPLSVIKGRACYWVRLGNLTMTLRGNASSVQVDGSIDVDIGGGIDGCIRKFWDCTWRWECARFGLGLKGPTGVRVRLIDGDRVTFKVEVTRLPDVDTGLPWPFDEIINALLWPVKFGIQNLVNIVLAFLEFEVGPKVIDVPNQKTDVHLGPFRPMYFERKTSGSIVNERVRYAGYRVGIEGKPA